MATRGPKPTPTNLRVLRGNPGHRPLNKNEPEPEIEAPPVPDFLSDYAKEEWEFIAPLLIDLGLLTKIDKAGLAGYCHAFGTWRQMLEELNKFGPFLKKREKRKNKETGETEIVDTGELYENPMAWVANRAWNQMTRMLAEFGMTPSSRSRIMVNTHEKMNNEYEKWKRRRGKK